MIALPDIGPEWVRVAVRVSEGGRDTWRWDMPAGDRAVVERAARDAPDAVPDALRAAGSSGPGMGNFPPYKGRREERL